MSEEIGCASGARSDISDGPEDADRAQTASPSHEVFTFELHRLLMRFPMGFLAPATR